MTEYLWRTLRENFVAGLEDESIIIANWSIPNEKLIDLEAEKAIEFMQEIVVAVRAIKHLYNIQQKTSIPLYLYTEEDEKGKLIDLMTGYIKYFSDVCEVWVSEKPFENPEEVVNGVEIYVPVEGFVDVDVTLKRFEREIEELDRITSALRKRLESKEFIVKAPRNVFEKEKRKLEELEVKREKLMKTREGLKKRKKEAKR